MEIISFILSKIGRTCTICEDYCQTPVQVFGLGVDFVLPVSQQEQQQQEPHQNLPEGSVLEV